ncbi:tetratricopeptide repeat protein [candidate division CSSED10-310 bacterium]|uniref:Tetratricopeptide repeat protein n=1 Tax=candidate division CSSED10-310 bacterium TaxID=2855610 RepID=A0ABV6YZM8_UNCC1
MNVQRSNSLLHIKFLLLFFLLILLWQVIFNFFLFPQKVFYKYAINSQKFIDQPVPDERWLDFSPLYLWIHIALNTVKLDSWRVLPLVQILVANLALFLFYRIMCLYISNFSAALSVVFIALYPTFNLYTVCQEPEVFIFFLNIAGLFFTLVKESSFLSGTFFALSVLARPSALPFVILVGFFQKKNKVTYFLPLVMILIMMLCFAWWATGSPTLTYMSPGTVFYEGNNPHTPGLAPHYPAPLKIWELSFPTKKSDFAHVLYRKISTFEAGETLSLADHQFFWLRKVFHFILDCPGDWLQLMVNKLWFSLINKEIHDIFSLVEVEGKLSYYAYFSFGIFVSLALLGIVFQYRRIPFLIFGGTMWYLTSLTLFYVTSRQRMAFFTFVIFLAAFGLEEIRKRKYLAGVLLIIFSITLIQPATLKGNNRTFGEVGKAWQFLGLAKKKYQQAKIGGTGFFFAKCLRAAPYLSPYIQFPPWTTLVRNPYANALFLVLPRTDTYNLGLLHFSALDYEGAFKMFEKIKYKRIYKHFYAIEPPIYYYLVCAYNLGKKENIGPDLNWALETYPGYAPLLALKTAFGEEADLLRYHDLFSSTYYQGKAYIHLEMYQQAIPCFERLTHMAPELTLAHEHLALSLGFTAEYERMTEEIRLFLISHHKKPLPLWSKWQRLHNQLKIRPDESPEKREAFMTIQALFPHF